MKKNKAVTVLAIVSAVLCGLFIICIALTVIFQGDLIKLLMNVNDMDYNTKILPAGAILRILCAAALTVVDARLIKGEGLESNLYFSYAGLAVMLAGGTLADIIQVSSFRDPESAAVLSSLRSLAAWVQPLLLAGAVMTIVASSVDIHIQKRTPLSSSTVKIGLGITAAYTVILLLVISLQGIYTGAEAFVFPLGSIIELISAICMLVSGVLMLFGTDMNATLPLMISVSAFISCCFLETPLNVAYSYFLGHFLGVKDLAALGTVSAYAGYASYFYFAGSAVTMVSAAVFIIDKKNNSSVKKGRVK